MYFFLQIPRCVVNINGIISMDPWNVSAVSDTSDPRRPSQVFDNSFLELDKPVYHKLQDSEHYISKLEEKLKNITTGKQGTNAV